MKITGLAFCTIHTSGWGTSRMCESARPCAVAHVRTGPREVWTAQHRLQAGADAYFLAEELEPVVGDSVKHRALLHQCIREDPDTNPTRRHTQNCADSKPFHALGVLPYAGKVCDFASVRQQAHRHPAGHGTLARRFSCTLGTGRRRATYRLLLRSAPCKNPNPHVAKALARKQPRPQPLCAIQ